MRRWTRFRRTLEQPAYRAKLAFFLILGIAVFLLAVLLQSHSPFWSEVLLEFAVTFGAVGVLQLLWDFLGGDPLEVRIEKVQQSVTLLSDLADGNVGIERIWPDRRTWQADPADGLRTWHDRVCQAKSIDMVSNTLWHNWMYQEEFRKALFENIAQGAHVRILVYDPDSEVLCLRAKDEEDMPGEMQMEIKATLLRMAEGWSGLPASGRANFEVRLTTQTLHPTQMIRADKQMLIAIYLSGKSGSPSPTMQLRDSKSSYFGKYAKQFETLWQRAVVLNDDQFSEILQEYRRSSVGPVESRVHT